MDYVFKFVSFFGLVALSVWMVAALVWLVFVAFRGIELARSGTVEKALNAKRNQIWELAKEGDEAGLRAIFREIGVAEEEAVSMLGFSSIEHLVAVAQDPEVKNLLLALAGTRKASEELRRGLGKWKRVGGGGV